MLPEATAIKIERESRIYDLDEMRAHDFTTFKAIPGIPTKLLDLNLSQFEERCIRFFIDW